MRIPRCYIDIELTSGSEHSLPEATRHHLVNVLRMRMGFSLRVFNGRDALEATAELTEVSKKSATLKLGEITAIDTESPLDIQLVQALSKGDKMDLTIQKAVELGVKSVQPINSERAAPPPKEERLEKRQGHWQGVSESATEQSGRCLLSPVAPLQSFSDYLDNRDKSRTAILFAPEGEFTLNSLPLKSPHIDILVGPEGGFSPEEIALAKAAGVESVTLGPRILRTETAGLTAIAVLQSRFGDLCQ